MQVLGEAGLWGSQALGEGRPLKEALRLHAHPAYPVLAQPGGHTSQVLYAILVLTVTLNLSRTLVSITMC